jgi:hypothetical protein
MQPVLIDASKRALPELTADAAPNEVTHRPLQRRSGSRIKLVGQLVPSASMVNFSGQLAGSFACTSRPFALIC